MTTIQHNGNYYDIHRTNDTTSENAPIFSVNVWNAKGQKIDYFEIVANSMNEVIDRITD